jgi:hypothetical protein
MAAPCALAAIYVSTTSVDRSAHRFVEDVFYQRWESTYACMSPAEKSELKMNQADFVKFCNAYAESEWPSRDHYEMEEIIPYVAPNAQLDTSWSLDGAHKYAITFRRPDGATDFIVKLNYRHDFSGEWHPDVFQFVFAVAKNMPQSHAVPALIAALKACGRDTLETYPFHSKTSLTELNRVEKAHRGAYLKLPNEHLD